MPQWLVIGVSGVTCGGKTTLANNLREYFLSQRNVQLWNTPYSISDVQLVSQDEYFLPVDDLRHKWNDKLNAINFELLTALDMKQMLSDIAWTMKGRYLAGDPLMENIDYINEISMSTNFEHYAPQLAHYRYHYHPHVTNHQGSGQLHGNTPHIIRVNSQASSRVHDNKINILIVEGFMIFNQPELLTLCNMKFHFHLPYEKCFERRGKRTYEPPDVTGYFEICVWPHYEKNFAEYRDRKDIIFLNGEMCKEKIFQFVVQKIMIYFEERCADLTCPPPHKFLQIQNNSMPTSCSANTSIGRTCPMEHHME